LSAVAALAAACSARKARRSAARIAEIPGQLSAKINNQRHQITENDLRDMSSLTITLPLPRVIVAEKPFVNTALQAGL
jgi:hypothetical protein